MTTDASAFAEQLRKLRQTRQFTDESVPEEALNAILEVARWSGSAKNTQPWHFIVVTEREDLQLLSEAGQFAGFLANAPLAIVMAMVDGGSRTVAYDEGRVSERIMLAADAYGLGAGTGWFSSGPDGEDRIKTKLGIPDSMAVRQAIAIGYPSDGDQRARTVTGGRKPREEVFSFGRYGHQRQDAG